MTQPTIEARLTARAAAIMPGLIALRRDLHQHPELAFSEIRTSRLVAERLSALGLEVRTDLGCTGVVALLRGARPGRTVALRADIDALPVNEQNDLPYRSEVPGVMHACGHDGHTAVLVGVAETLAAVRDEFEGNVKFIFQPAEEPVTGAKALLDAGVLRNPEVDSILALHGWPGVPEGTVELVDGPVMASSDFFFLTILGRGGHGAMPQLALDPVIIAAHVVTALQHIVSREIAPLQPAVLSVTSLQAGETFNVIPDEARLQGTVRTLDPAVRALIPERIKRILDGVCAAFGATAQFEYRKACPVTLNDPRVCAAVRAAAAPLLSGEKLLTGGTSSMAAEDFALFAQEVPGALLRLGLGDVPSLHNPKFDFNDNALPVGVAVLSRAALRLLRGIV